VPVVSPIFPSTEYPAAGRRILSRIAEEHPGAPVEALYGYESMRVVLQALRAAGKRAPDRLAVIDAARESGPKGSVIGTYRFDDRGDSSRRNLALYDLERGRLDKTYHPFCTRFAHGDIRITTRVRQNDLGEALFSTLHETGHALYEQGVSADLDGTPLAHGASIGVHESQSRLWENVVGRSRGFWEHYYPQLQEAFPGQLGPVGLDTFYRAINKVTPSLIRTDADEVTYNVHVMLRFDLELDLLEGRLAVKDLPEAWRARMESDLGVTPRDDRDGVLQDVHWFSDGIGGCFHSYAIGNILCAQIHAAAVTAHPDIPREIARGEFATLHGWLRQNLYRHGRKYPPDEIIRRATGEPLTMRPYLEYLRQKYGELYRLPAFVGRISEA
jgi:carboxypeptidase Taq